MGVVQLFQRWSISKHEMVLFIVSLLVLGVQLYIAPHTMSRVDIAYYLRDAREIVDRRHYFDFYRHTVYEYPPLWAYYISLVYLIHPVTNRRDPGFLTLIKIPLILSDVILGILLFYYVRREVGSRKALLYSTLLLLHPHMLFISAMWGMNDSICAMFLFSSIFLLRDGNIWKSAVLMGLALLVKQYAAFPLVFILALILKKYGRSEACAFLLTAFSPLFVISIPYLLADPEPYLRAITFNVSEPQLDIRLKSGVFWRFIKYVIENHTTIDTPPWLTLPQYPLFALGFLLVLLFFYSRIPSNRKEAYSFVVNDAVLLSVLYFLIFCPVVHPQWYVLLMPFVCVRLALMKKGSEILWYIPTLLPFIHHFVFTSSIRFDSTEPLDTFIHMVWAFRSETAAFWYIPIRTGIFVGLLALFLRLLVFYEKDLHSLDS